MLMITTVLALFTIVTIVIVSRNLVSRSGIIFYSFVTILSGAIAFLLSFLLQMILYYVNWEFEFINVLIEEIFKITAALLVWKIARPLATVAAFAGIEVVAGKFFVPFWIDAGDIMATINDHGIYLLVVVMAAYNMHILTGIVYNSLGTLKGLLPALGIHFIYNLLAGWTEKTASLSMGVTLLAATSVFIAVPILGKSINVFGNFKRESL